MPKHASHNHAVTGNDIEYPIYGQCPFYGHSIRTSYNFHSQNNGVSRKGGGWSIGHAEKNWSVLRVTRYYVRLTSRRDESRVNLARTRVSLSLSLSLAVFRSSFPLSSTRTIAWSKLKRTSGERSRAIERVLCADLSPSPQAFRSRPNCPFPAVNPNEGFPVERYASRQRTMARSA